MRRILLVTCGVLLLAIIGGIVLFTGSLSARTWLAEKALRSSDETVHEYAAQTLMATDPEAALEIFIEVARDELAAGNERQFGFVSFRLIPLELVEDLARFLDDPDTLRAAAAADAVRILANEHEEHPFRETIPGLTRAMARDTGALRRSATYALGSLGQRAREAAPSLLAALKEGFFEAAYSLREMHLSESEVLELVKLLDHQDLRVRFSVVHALAEFKEHRQRIAEPLVALLDNENGGLVGAVLRSLNRIEQRDTPTVRRVIALVERDDVREEALDFLANDLEAQGSLEAFVLALKNAQRASDAFGALRRMRTDTDSRVIPQALVSALLDVCRGADENLRSDAVQILGSMGSASRSALPALREMAADEKDEDLKREIEETIGELETPEGVP